MGRNFSLLAHQLTEAAQLYADGASVFRISQIFGVAHDCVKRAFIAAGIKIRNPREQAQCRPMTLERIKLNCTVSKSGCWIYGSKPTKNGYCRIHFGGTWCYVHRIAYALATGKKLQRNIDIRQDCGNRRCCNPECLEAGTRKTTMSNARLSRGILHGMAVQRGRAAAAQERLRLFASAITA